MARDHIIQPKRNTVSAGDEPRIDFKGLNAGPVYAIVEDDGTVTFRTASRVLLSFKDGLDNGVSWSVNDPSGFTFLEVNETNNEVIIQVNNNNDIVVSDTGVKIKSISQEVVTDSATTTYVMNLALASKFNISISGNTAFSFSNVPPGYNEVTLRVISTAADTPTYTGVLFDTTPGVLTANEPRVITFYTFNGGVEWIGDQNVAGAT